MNKEKQELTIESLKEQIEFHKKGTEEIIQNLNKNLTEMNERNNKLHKEIR